MDNEVESSLKDVEEDTVSVLKQAIGDRDEQLSSLCAKLSAAEARTRQLEKLLEQTGASGGAESHEDQEKTESRSQSLMELPQEQQSTYTVIESSRLLVEASEEEVAEQMNSSRTLREISPQEDGSEQGTAAVNESSPETLIELSLPCVKRHKSESGCSGVRDKAAFVPIGEFDEINLLSGTNEGNEDSSAGIPVKESVEQEEGEIQDDTDGVLS
ncbi:Box C/D snoRNA protein 1 [Acipenser ruthenus]|uniref:Box C/D snoRNA protein 1 n=1 Tax=Acipenser ruthenus TaxID=7906 RepID=A0A444UGK3_ACIRT|nr:Box C/D snoRNA protein 1 [Acipenser ruthenus]